MPDAAESVVCRSTLYVCGVIRDWLGFRSTGRRAIARHRLFQYRERERMKERERERERERMTEREREREREIEEKREK